MRADAFASITSVRASTSGLSPPFNGCSPKPVSAAFVRVTPCWLMPEGIEAAADWDNLKSPETYVGYDRAQNFASRGGAELDRRRVYAVPARLALNQWDLAGEWTMCRQATVLGGPKGRLCTGFARDLHLVMGVPEGESPVRFRVSIDGQPPGPAHGLDVDEGGNGTVVEQRLYQLIRQPKPIVDRTFEMEFLDAGVETFAFTFG
jgi:hypothetical protein